MSVYGIIKFLVSIQAINLKFLWYMWCCGLSVCCEMLCELIKKFSFSFQKPTSSTDFSLQHSAPVSPLAAPDAINMYVKVSVVRLFSLIVYQPLMFNLIPYPVYIYIYIYIYIYCVCVCVCVCVICKQIVCM